MKGPTILLAGACLGVRGRRFSSAAANDNPRRGAVAPFLRLAADRAPTYRGIACAALARNFVIVETLALEARPS